MKIKTKATLVGVMALHRFWRSARIASAVSTLLLAVAVLGFTGISPVILFVPAIAFAVSAFFETQYGAVASNVLDGMCEPCPCDNCSLGRR